MLLTAVWALVSLPAVVAHHLVVVDLAQAAAVLLEQCPLVEVVAGVWVLEHPQLLPLDLRVRQPVAAVPLRARLVALLGWPLLPGLRLR